MSRARISHIDSVLCEIEWNEGLSMPVANAENKALENEIQKKQENVYKFQNSLEVLQDRIHAMSNHLKNVRQELHHTQGLVGARQKETETERHLFIIAEREEGRLQQEIKKLEQAMDNLKEQKNMFENNIFKKTQVLEELKLQMNWDQQALEAWLEESAHKDEDCMAIQKYSRFDESKIKELSLQMEKMVEELIVKQRKLNHETTETLSTQIDLDKTAEDFRKIHRERQELIQQWENIIDQMQRRDREMDHLADQLAEVKAEVRKCEETIKEKQQFLENEMENNAEEEKSIAAAERNATRIRTEYQEAETQRIKIQDELEALKRMVDRTATDVEATRSVVTQLKKDIVDKENRLTKAKEVRVKLEEKLKLAIISNLTAEERVTCMDEHLAEEDKHQKEIDKNLKHLREVHFKQIQDFQEIKQKERHKEVEIQRNQAAIRNMISKVAKLDTDSIKQQEIIYSQDYTLQVLERRISRMQGDRSNEEKVLLEAKIKELTEELEHKDNLYMQLTLQLRRLQDDIRKVSKELEKIGYEKGSLSGKIEELNLFNDNSERELKNLISSKHDMMVDQNIHRLELKRLRMMLNERADEVFSLEKRSLQLETAMKERHNEIHVHKEMLNAQIRVVNEERQQVSAELHERISKIDRLRNRYEILMVSMTLPDGEEERSQAYCVIKAAQEKEELQCEGDEMDAKIQKAEKEIRALENTLKLLSRKNESYRKSFNKVKDSSDELLEKQNIDEQLRAVMDKLKYKKRQIKEIQEDLHTMGNTLDNIHKDEDNYMDLVEDKKSKIFQLNKELEDQRVKLERVTKQNLKYAKDLRAVRNTTDQTPEERDFNIRKLRDFNKSVMQLIGDVVQVHPELTEAVTMYFSQAKLPPLITGFMSTSSTRSSVSSMRSSLTSPKTPSGTSLGRIVIGADFGGPSPASSHSYSTNSSVRSQHSGVSGRR